MNLNELKIPYISFLRILVAFLKFNFFEPNGFK